MPHHPNRPATIAGKSVSVGRRATGAPSCRQAVAELLMGTGEWSGRPFTAEEVWRLLGGDDEGFRLKTVWKTMCRMSERQELVERLERGFRALRPAADET